jgi:hypothetical protein
MADPRCPGCSKTLTYLHGARFVNPWKCKCPHCAATLEMSTAWKWVYGACLGLSMALAGVAIYQEERGHWQTADSLMFFFWALVVLLPLSWGTWRLMRLKLKDEGRSDSVR